VLNAVVLKGASAKWQICCFFGSCMEAEAFKYLYYWATSQHELDAAYCYRRLILA